MGVRHQAEKFLDVGANDAACWTLPLPAGIWGLTAGVIPNPFPECKTVPIQKGATCCVCLWRGWEVNGF